MSEKLTLGYWNVRGLAERVRLLLAYLNFDFDQVILTPEKRSDWVQKIKPEFIKKNPAANLPYLQDGDRIISETEAILVYLCHKANRPDLLGESAEDQVQLATVKGVFQDLSRAYSGYIYGQKTLEEFKQQAINSLKVYFVKLDGLLGDKQWFASKLSYVDIVLGDFLQVISLFNENFSKDFPRLKALQERIWGLEGISSYLKSDKFIERPINSPVFAKWY